MTNKMTLTHGGIQAYLKGKIDERIIKTREEDSQLKLLFDLLDQITLKVTIPETDANVKIPQSFAETEEILSDLLAGSITEKNKENFLGALFYSADFYHKVLLKLADFGKIMETEVPTEMETVKIKSDEDLMSEMGIGKGVAPAAPAEEKSKFKIRGISEKLFGWLIPIPRYAYTAAALVLAFIIIISGSTVFYFVSRDTQEEDIFAEYVWDDKVPYEYDVTRFRSSGNNFVQDEKTSFFIEQFNVGISEYLIMNYSDATEIFKNNVPLAAELLSLYHDEEVLKWAHDFYFYSGVAFLALGRSHNLRKEVKQENCLYAVDLLKKALSLSQENDFIKSDRDRDSFFLGLAKIFAEQTDSAIEKFSEIPKSSIYYPESKKVNDWLKKKKLK